MDDELIRKIVIRFVIGGASVTAVSLLSEMKNPIYAGIFYSFPAMMLVAMTTVFLSAGAIVTRDLISSVLITFPLFFIFLAAYYFISFKCGPWTTMFFSLSVWLAATLAFLKMYSPKG